jgi:hypothetical protein
MYPKLRERGASSDWLRMQTHRALGSHSLNLAHAMSRRLATPEEKMDCQRSLFAFCASGWLARAARPLAGGLPKFGRDQAAQTGSSVAALRNYGRVRYEIEHRSSLGASSGLTQRQPKYKASIQSAA